MSWKTLKILLLITSLGQTGCVQIRDRVDECLINTQDKKIIEKGWRNHQQYWIDQPFPKDFRKGFKAGYEAGLQGEDCPPAIPPRYYWSAANRGPHAEHRTKAWFDGWWMGSVAVNSDGLYNHRRVHVAPHLLGQKTEPEIDWENATEEQLEHLPLVPIPEPSEDDMTPDMNDGTAPLVPPAIEPPSKDKPEKDPKKEYNPRVTRPELYQPIQ